MKLISNFYYSNDPLHIGSCAVILIFDLGKQGSFLFITNKTALFLSLWKNYGDFHQDNLFLSGSFCNFHVRTKKSWHSSN